MKLRILFFAFIFFIINPSNIQAEEFEDTALGKELIDLGLKFLENPGDFFFNIHSDNEDFSPLPSNRNGSIRLNFFPTVFPLTWGNVNLKVKVLNDKGYNPQIDLVGTYGDLIALRAASASFEDVEPLFNDYSIGAVISKAATDKTKIFGGFKYSTVNMDVTFSTPVVFGAFEMSSLNFKVADTFFFTGITHQSSPKKMLVAQAGYGFKYKKIISRIMMSYEHLEIGMDIFPEGLFVIHPFMAWHWYF